MAYHKVQFWNSFSRWSIPQGSVLKLTFLIVYHKVTDVLDSVPQGSVFGPMLLMVYRKVSSGIGVLDAVRKGAVLGQMFSMAYRVVHFCNLFLKVYRKVQL